MFGNKLAPKNVKLCPGCPPKKIEPVIVPKFVLPNPPNSQVINIVNMNNYRNGKKENQNINTLF